VGFNWTAVVTGDRIRGQMRPGFGDQTPWIGSPRKGALICLVEYSSPIHGWVGRVSIVEEDGFGRDGFGRS
jgi:hypothetical protein